LASGWLLAGTQASASDRLACLTDAAAISRPIGGTRSAYLYVSAEERRPLASGTKLILVRGDVPDPGAAALARVVDDAYRMITGELGLSGFPDRVAISFAEIDGEGYVTTSARGTSVDIVLSRALGGNALVHALAHQLGHVAAAAYAHDEPHWWNEASAAWVEQKIAPDDDALAFRAAGGWLTFLELRFGAEAVRRIWEESSAMPGPNAGRAIESVLASLGSSLRAETEAYAAWAVAESRRHLVPGRDPGALPLAAEVTSFPGRGRIASGPDTLGVMFLRFVPEATGGGLKLEIQADPASDWTACAVLVPIGSVLPTARVALVRSTPGRAELNLPTAELGEVIVAVVNLSSNATLGVSYQASVDETFPYVLRRFDAAAEGGAIRLSWETASESAIQGWSIWRSAEPSAGYSELNSVLVPAAQTLGIGGGLEYSWLDPDVEAGRSYFYYLEALTAEGLKASSFLVSVTAK
jgi:hypothetical protein